jgi:hypothetical protein
MHSHTLFYLLLFFTLGACKTTKTSNDPGALIPEIVMQKNLCFGKCPYYTLTIYEGGLVEFDGKKFVEKFGLYNKKLSKKEYRAVKRAFKNADLWSFENTYPSNLSDLPKTQISFTQNNQTKSIIGDINRPQIVKGLDQLLVSIANSGGWTLLSVPDMKLPEGFIEDELIISVKPYTNIREWIKKYPDWNFEIIEEIGRDRNLYLLKFDAHGLQPSQVMNKLSMDDDVKVAEFNKKVKGRN